MVSVPPAAPPRRGTQLPADVATGLWVLCLLDLTYGTWLLAVTHDAAGCSGLPCSVATLGDHPMGALALSQAGAALLVVLLPITRGPTAMGGLRTAAIAVAALGGAIGLAGVAALIIGAALVLVVAVAILICVIDNL